MKVNCVSIGQIVSTRKYTKMEMVAALVPILNKSASVTVADSATGADLVAAARAAFAIAPSVVITRVALVMNGAEVDGAKTLSDLDIKEGSSVQIRLAVTL